MKHIQKSIILLALYTHLSGASMHPFDVDSYFGSSEKINQRYNNQWKKWRQEVTEDNAVEKMQHAQAQLDMHRQRIGREKEIVLFSLKTRNNIPDIVWNVALQMRSEIKEFAQKKRVVLVGGAVHDSKIPVWFLSMIKNELVKRGHNPAAINIYNIESASSEISSSRFEFSLSEGILSIERTSYGSIGINCRELKEHSKPGDYQQGQCMRLVKLLQRVGISCLGSILAMLSVDNISSIPIPEKEIITLNNFDTKKSVYEIALKNKQGARCIKKWHSKSYADEIDIEDYERLSDICFQWESLSWLKKYFSNNYHSIPLALKSKCGSIASVQMLLSRGMVVTKQIIDAEKNNESSIKKLLQHAYGAQYCCICLEHPEDMRDVPCRNKHVGNFICRKCYNAGKVSQLCCPICTEILLDYNTVR